MRTILINLMDKEYDDNNHGYNETREYMDDYLSSIDSPIQNYDKYVSILNEEKTERENKLFEKLGEIASASSDENCIYIRFIGHLGQPLDANGNPVVEIEDFRLCSFVPRLFELFPGKKLIINMLGSCCSCLALPFVKAEAKKKGNQCIFLYTTDKVTDQYSPDRFLIDKYAEDGCKRFEEFKKRWGHDDYSCWESPQQ
jgi:hypothetical protein